MLSINRIDLDKEIIIWVKKKLFLFALVITTLEIVKNVLETKVLGENSALKVTSPMLMRILFYLALFQTMKIVKTGLYYR